jgi:hypothetical protein
LSPGSTLPLIIDPKAFSKVPAAGLPFPSAPCFRTVLAVQGPLRRIFSNSQKILLCRAHFARALDRSGPFRNLPMRRERGQMQRPNAAQHRLRAGVCSRCGAPRLPVRGSSPPRSRPNLVPNGLPALPSKQSFKVSFARSRRKRWRRSLTRTAALVQTGRSARQGY